MHPAVQTDAGFGENSWMPGGAVQSSEVVVDTGREYGPGITSACLVLAFDSTWAAIAQERKTRRREGKGMRGVHPL